jgi:hypothetical protein
MSNFFPDTSAWQVLIAMWENIDKSVCDPQTPKDESYMIGASMKFAKTSMIAIVGMAFAGAASASTVSDTWSFSDGGSNSGNGAFTYESTTGLVSSFTGNYDGNALTFWDASTAPVQINNSGQLVYHGVPNTHGADYIFDDLFPFTVGGLLVSTGSGASQKFYDLSLDYQGASSVDFFSIDPNGGYVVDNGTFSASPVNLTAPVPEPSTWAMMILGFLGIGFMTYRRKSGALRVA